MRRACTKLSEENDEAARLVLSELCRRLQVRREPLLLRSREDGPLLMGLWRPAIVLPESMLRRGAHEAAAAIGEMRLVLAHEAAHLKRRDLAWNALLAVTNALFWFHPGLWLARREWRLAVEEASDELALEATGMPAARFGALLLQIAARRPAAVAATASVGVAEDYELLHRRISALAHAGRGSQRAVRLGAVLLAASAVGLVPLRVAVREAGAQAPASTAASTGAQPGSVTAGPTAPVVLVGRYEQASSARSLAFSPDGQRLASTVGASRIQLWQVAPDGLKSEKALVAPGASHTGSQIAFGRSGQVLVEASHQARLWDVASGRVRASLQAAAPTAAQRRVYGPGFAVAAAVSPDGNMVASTGQFLIVHARQANGTWKKVLQQKFYYGLGVAFSPDGKSLIEVGHNGRLNIWDASALRRGLQVITGGAGMRNAIRSFVYGKASSKPTPDQYARFLLELRTGPTAEPDAWNNPMRGFALSPDGAWIGTSHAAYKRRIYAPVPTERGRYPYRGGQLLIDGKPRKFTEKPVPSSIVLRDGRSAKFARVLTAPSDINALAFSPNGRVVAAGCEDGVRFWEIASGRLLFTLSDAKSVRALAFSPDGRLLATGSDTAISQLQPDGRLRGGDKSVRLWRFAAPSTSPNTSGASSTSDAPDYAPSEVAALLPDNATLAQVLAAPREQMIPISVLSPAGRPVAGAQVFWDYSQANGSPQQDVFTTDAQGRFQFPIGRVRRSGGAVYQTLLIADAPGFGPTRYDMTPPRKARREVIRLRQATKLRLQVLAPGGQPVSNSAVRVARLGYGASSWVRMPREILSRYQGRTDARGRVQMSGLPQGMLAELALGDERFAPLSTEDNVLLSGATVSRVLRLQSPAVVLGRVTLGTTGQPVAGSRVLARRINRAEAAGNVVGRDSAIASTQADAQGRYVLSGLRPGRYVMWTWPSDKIRRDWVSVNPEVTLREGAAQIVNFTLIKGALIEGRVVSARTGQPIARQTMGLLDAEENYQYTDSKGDGSFRFRAVGGKQHLWVHANAASPPPGYALPAKDKFDFSVANGAAYRITIRLPHATIARAIRGQVLGEGGAPVANAQVNVEGLGGMGDYSRRAQLKADAQGRFTVDAKIAVRPVRLWAQAGALRSARGTVAIGGDSVTLRVGEKNEVAVGARVLSEGGQPLPGIEVELMSLFGNVALRAATATTNAQGQVRFKGQRAATLFWLRVQRRGYAPSYADIGPLQVGASAEETIKLQRADSFVAGRVLLADGTPAAGAQVSASGSLKSVVTDAGGGFRIDNVVRGPITIYVSPSGYGPSQPYRSQSGRSNVRITLARLSKGSRQAWNQNSDRFESRQAALLGQAAPEIRAQGWLNSPAQPALSLRGLRGQIVLLHFWSGQFFPGRAVAPEVSEIAQDFAPRGLRVIGVHHMVRPARQPLGLARVREISDRLGLAHPIALDAPSPQDGPSPLLSATANAYAGGPYAVVDRAGRVVYVGDSLGAAMTTVANLLDAN